jgi:Uncharacterized conserved protein, COG3270
MILDFLKERFGIEEGVFEGFKFVKVGDDVWIMSDDVPQKLHGINRVGLRFAMGISRNPKITTAVLQIFGKFATKNIIYIDEEQLKDYIMGKDVEVGEIEGVERGQVIVKFKEDVIGSGLYDGRVIKNQIPKARRIL